MRHSRKLLLGVMFVACLSRGGALWVWSDHLNQDRDVYLALAEGMAAGRGYSIPGTGIPTAYRPPFYPLLLVLTGTFDSHAGRGAMNLLLGVATVWLTYRLALLLELREELAVAAAGLVAIDPLLIRYASFPMTETLTPFLSTAMLVAIASLSSVRGSALAGCLFGLSALTRPTVWAFGGLLVLYWFIRRMSNSRSGEQTESSSTSVRLAGVGFVVAALTVSPWVVRNWIVMGHPIVMTTHGGYTLLLGNNPAYYREVVGQPWGTVWDGSVGRGQAAWVQSVLTEMQDAGVTGEVAEDRWMGQRAWRNIRNEPASFLRACLLRFRRFWALTPAGAEANDIPSWLRIPLTAYYGAVFGLMVIGLFGVLKSSGRSRCWMPSLLLLAAFVSAHLVYWSDARMRAPVVPVIALLAARGLAGWRDPSQTSAETPGSPVLRLP